MKYLLLMAAFFLAACSGGTASRFTDKKVARPVVIQRAPAPVYHRPVAPPSKPPSAAPSVSPLIPHDSEECPDGKCTIPPFGTPAKEPPCKDG